jgi:hypothetical protein
MEYEDEDVDEYRDEDAKKKNCEPPLYIQRREKKEPKLTSCDPIHNVPIPTNEENPKSRLRILATDSILCLNLGSVPY